MIYHVLHFHAAVSWVQGSNLLRPYGREEAFMQGRFNNGSSVERFSSGCTSTQKNTPILFEKTAWEYGKL
ncbi:hypothetical protein [Prevotella nigrescens]|uniref:hypothetical protein n=1 Tax=Prevotella nigrescens TaxID=28133 RepID=UPI00243101E0|nr:hypothetical protein [Prevotella nigrescens]